MYKLAEALPEVIGIHARARGDFFVDQLDYALVYLQSALGNHHRHAPRKLHVREPVATRQPVIRGMITPKLGTWSCQAACSAAGTNRQVSKPLHQCATTFLFVLSMPAAGRWNME